MSEKIVISKECVKECFESKFLSMYDLQYREGKHYYDATRRNKENLVATMSDEEFLNLKPDAVSCCIIIHGDKDKVLFTREFRYPTGQFILGVVAGLIDPEDFVGSNKLNKSDNAGYANYDDAIITAAIRELHEETGLVASREQVKVVNPLLFSSPGMTDECNAIVCIDLDESAMKDYTVDNCEGSELFDGFVLLDREEAKKVYNEGRDSYGRFYSVYTWIALSYFLANCD